MDMRAASPPRVPPHVIPRPRLLEVLRGRFERRLTTIAGAAGFGKTTLLSQAIVDNDRLPRGTDLWCSCDATMTSADALMRAFAPEHTEVASPVEAAQAIAEKVWARSPSDVCVVLDDVHLVGADTSAASTIGQLCSLLPANGHLLVAGRTLPSLPRAQLRAQREYAEIVERDLLLTDEELAKFAHERGVAPESLAPSGGWPALTELAASVGGHHLPGYLWEQYLQGLPTQTRQLLAKLALVRVADDSLASALMGTEVVLDDVLRDVPLIGRRDGLYVPHALWRDALGDEIDADTRRAALVAGAEFAQRNGDLDRAFELLIESGASDAAARLIVQVASAGSRPISHSVARRWRDQARALLGNQTEFQLLIALSEEFGDNAAAVPALTRAAERFQAAGDIDGEFAATVRLAIAHYFGYDTNALATVAIRIIELAEQGYEPAASTAHLVRTTLALRAPDLDLALVHVNQVDPSRLIPEVHDLYVWLRATVLHRLGRPDEALSALDDALDVGTRDMRLPLESTRLIALRGSGRSRELRDQRALVERLCRDDYRPSSTYSSLFVAAATYAGEGRSADARRLSAEANRLGAVTTMGPSSLIEFAHIEALCAIVEGEEQTATDLLRGLGTVNANEVIPDIGMACYVLLEETRASWDAATLGPSFARARSLVRALVAARETGPSAVRATIWPGIDWVDWHLTVAWSTELACWMLAVGRDEVREILDEPHPGRTAVLERLTTSPHEPLRRSSRDLLGTIEPAPAVRLELRTFGAVELLRDDVVVDAQDWRRERVRALLCRIVARGSATREQLAFDLWPDFDAEKAARNLRVNLSYLLRVLDPARDSGTASAWIADRNGMLLLRPHDRFTIDTADFSKALDAARAAEAAQEYPKALAALRQAVSLYRGDYGMGLNEDHEWLETERDRLRVAFVSAATRAAELSLAAEADDEACDLARRVLHADPYSEAAYRVLIASSLNQGNRDLARTLLQECSTALAELGVELANETQMLARRAGAAS